MRGIEQRGGALLYFAAYERVGTDSHEVGQNLSGELKQQTQLVETQKGRGGGM